MSEEVDQYTGAWWKKQWEGVKEGYRGMNHTLNCCRADYVDCLESIKALREQSAAQAKALEEAQAEIGRLLDEVGVLKDRLDMASKKFQELRNERSTP